MYYLIYDLSYLINIINRVTSAMAVALVRKGQLTQFGGALRVPNGAPGRQIEYPFQYYLCSYLKHKQLTGYISI
jgi:hypothetical protein